MRPRYARLGEGNGPQALLEIGCHVQMQLVHAGIEAQLMLKCKSELMIMPFLQGWFALFLGEQEIYLCKDDSISWLSR